MISPLRRRIDPRRRTRCWRTLAILTTIVLLVLAPSAPSRADDLAPAGAAPTSPPAPGEVADIPDLMRDDLTFVAVPALPADFALQDRGWIRFGFPKSESHRVQRLVDAAEEVRGSLASELGADVLDRVEVRVARTPTEMAALAPPAMPPPRYAVGVAYARVRLVVLSIESPNSPELPDLAEVLRHELAHVGLFDAVHGHHVPRWFNEGFAIHASGESSLQRARVLWGASLSKRLIPLSDLDRGFPASDDRAAIAYAQSADFVRYLLRRQDRERFKRMIERVARGQPFERALADAYSSNLRGLEFEWREQLRGRTSYVPVFLGGGVLWVLVFVVVGVGWHRRRKRHKTTLQRWAKEEALEQARAASPGADVVRIKLIPRPPLPPRLEAIEPPPGASEAQVRSPEQAEHGAARPPVSDVPRVEHDGRWHTLH